MILNLHGYEVQAVATEMSLISVYDGASLFLSIYMNNECIAQTACILSNDPDEDMDAAIYEEAGFLIDKFDRHLEDLGLPYWGPCR